MPLSNHKQIVEAFVGIASHAWRRFKTDRGWRMAAGLSYTSLLAIIPLAAITFSMLAAFPVFEGMRDQIQDAIFSNLLPQSADSMRDQFDQFIANTTSLSSIGIIGIVATTILLFVTIEADLNAIFRVSKPRPLIPRLLVFWAMITLGPVLVGTALSLATYAFVATQWLGVDAIGGVMAWPLFGRALSSLLIAAAFTVFYVVIPNRAVSPRAALVGGLSAGVLFTALRYMFGWYVATFPTYQSIYGALSVVPIFLIWMFLSWTVVLLGAYITTAVTDWRRAQQASRFTDAGPDERINIAMALLAVLFGASKIGRTTSRTRLIKRSLCDEEQVDMTIVQLRNAGFVDTTMSDEWVLSRDMGTATLFELYEALGLSLSEEGASHSETGWRKRLADHLGKTRDHAKESMTAPLRDILEDH